MRSLFQSFKDGLSKTKSRLIGQVRQAVGAAAKIDDYMMDDIEAALIQGDVGVATSTKIITNLKKRVAIENITTSDGVIDALKIEISAILLSGEEQRPVRPPVKPEVWLIVGVNGTGKTTSVGKLAKYYREQGKKVMIAACDTFRAAAVDQLAIWAERSGVEFIRARDGSDPAAVAFDATQSAQARDIDLLIIDTAGRLHTKKHLMDELKKIQRVVAKVVPADQVKPKLIIDGTTGQNALSQAQLFTDAIGHIDGIIVTKLDGTAKGGVVIAVADVMAVPIDFIGLGEQIDNLKPFSAEAFADALFEK